MYIIVNGNDLQCSYASSFFPSAWRANCMKVCSGGGGHTHRHVRHMLIGQLRIHWSRRLPPQGKGKMPHYSLFARWKTYSWANLITISIMAPPTAPLASHVHVRKQRLLKIRFQRTFSPAPSHQNASKTPSSPLLENSKTEINEIKLIPFSLSRQFTSMLFSSALD